MKSYLLFVKNFNNYKNRKVVLPDITSIDDITTDYQCAYCVGPTQTTAIVDFNPNDGVTTSVIVNWSEEYTPDYLFVLDTADKTILSRWFVMEWKRTRGKQYQVALKRDVIAENFEQLKTSDVFVQKGIVDSDNPLIFNRENMSYNQIKTSETLLKDNTNQAWIVGYLDKDTPSKVFTSASQRVQQYIDISSMIHLNDESDISKGATFELLDGSINVRTRIKPYQASINQRLDMVALFNRNFDVTTSGKILSAFGTSYSLISNDADPLGKYVKACSEYRTNLKTNFEAYNENTNQNLLTDDQYKYLQSLEGQIVRVGDLYFKLSFNKAGLIKREINIYNSETSAALNAVMDTINARFKTYLSYVWAESEGNPYYIWWNATIYNVILEPADLPGDLTLTLSTNRRKLEDAPYDMFCMPYDSYTLRLAQNMARDLNAQCYDIQVLPYMPQNNCLTSTGTIDISLGDIDKDYSNVLGNVVYTKYKLVNNFTSLGGSASAGYLYGAIVKINKDISTLSVLDCTLLAGAVDSVSYETDVTNKTIEIRCTSSLDLSPAQIKLITVRLTYQYTVVNDTYCQIFYCTNSNRSFVLNGIDVDLNNPKLDNETKFARLVSPNWNGAYEFSPVKNGGINGFNVDITYKPYTPYIHVAPIFGNLYGTVQDARGLICNGDFSITMMNNAWESYELSNKNYQQIFNAQISTMDKNNQLSVVSNAISSQINALGTGVGTGLMTGNVYAGIAAGAASSIAGIADIGIQQAQYRNNKQLQIDQFGYQLGNIKAQPDTLNKVSTLTANNRIWPFIEFYEATEKEVEALKNKIKYNGMTIMAIGKMEDYIGREFEGLNYFQAQLIMNTDIACDTHLLDEIDLELQRGIYL